MMTIDDQIAIAAFLTSAAFKLRDREAVRTFAKLEHRLRNEDTPARQYDGPDYLDSMAKG